MRGLFILLFFHTLGEIGNLYLGVPLPGPIIGLFLLLITLFVVKTVPDDVHTTGNMLISNLGMLLVPAATGFCYYLVEIQGQILPIAAAASLGTVLAIAFTSLLMNSLLSARKKNCD